MRRLGGAIVQTSAAVILVGSVVGGLALYNADRRGSADLAAFEAAVTRASSPGVPIAGFSDFWGRLEVFPVIQDGTLNPVPDGVANDIWAAFMRMTTPAFTVENMSELRIARAPGNPTMAAVERDAADPARWSLTVNIASDLERPDYLRTLVHEYAHLLTLDDDQLDRSATRCRTTRLQDGCLLAGSTLERFQERFWRPYGEEAPSPDSDASPASWHLYFDHTGSFVSVYAATNVVEDLAESFTEFVVRDRPSPESGPWAQKILFFWDEPGYVAIRAHIRDWFGPELPEPELPTPNAHRG